ncbi:RNA polymerase sigma factor [Luteolibacter marinus]|uniref:RNA polymerase sigma factor n=1 Tax=Luteolibacter marinus TaxID=2776705 RepID=UPI0018684DBB|nr:sigma-70 family RNA polymerase sigma factor [Luteolibacter marinus]
MNAAKGSFFATTRWTLVGAAARDGDSAALEALGTLFETYWQPLYRYARRKGKTKEDAEDLVQGFFEHLMEARALQDIDRAKGRFRAFLLASFNHWMINDWRRGARLKRGGEATVLSLDWEDAETGLKLDPEDRMSPDRHYDREWALALLGKVIGDLETASAGEGNAVQFAVLKPCLTADSARIGYAGIAAQLGASEGAARVAVHRLRKRYRHLLTAEIARTLASPDAVEEEMRSLFAALADWKND